MSCGGSEEAPISLAGETNLGRKDGILSWILKIIRRAGERHRNRHLRWKEQQEHNSPVCLS